MKVKEGSERGKCWLKAQHSENEDHGIISRQIDAETMESDRLNFLELQNKWITTAEMKLRESCSLEEKL